MTSFPMRSIQTAAISQSGKLLRLKSSVELLTNRKFEER